jgi:hypothetical protein
MRTPSPMSDDRMEWRRMSREREREKGDMKRNKKKVRMKKCGGAMKTYIYYKRQP